MAGFLGFASGFGSGASKGREQQQDAKVKLFELMQQLKNDQLRNAIAQQELQQKQADAPLEAQQRQFDTQKLQSLQGIAGAETDPLTKAQILNDPSGYFKTEGGRKAAVGTVFGLLNNARDDRERQLLTSALGEAISGDPNKALSDAWKVATAKQERPPQPKTFKQEGIDPTLGPTSIEMEIDPATGKAKPVPFAMPPGMTGTTLPGGGFMARKATSAMGKSLDALAQAQNSLGDLSTAVDAYESKAGGAGYQGMFPKGSPMGPGGKLEPLGNEVAKRAYQSGFVTGRDDINTTAQQLFVQLSGAAASTGSRSKWFLQQIQQHFPHPWDSDDLIREKIGILGHISSQMKDELIRGPGSVTAPAIATPSAPAASKAVSLPMPPFKPTRFDFGGKYKKAQDADGAWWFLNPKDGQWTKF